MVDRRAVSYDGRRDMPRHPLFVPALAVLALGAAPRIAAAQVRADARRERILAAGGVRPGSAGPDRAGRRRAGRPRPRREERRRAGGRLPESCERRACNCGEQGLLGLAFAPDYATSGRVFVNFINLPGHTVIARFRRSASDPLRADPASRFDLVWPDGAARHHPAVRQPQRRPPRVRAGRLPLHRHGRRRIGQRSDAPRAEPAVAARQDAPHRRVGVRQRRARATTCRRRTRSSGRPASVPEIWSFGLRNPWRWSFDDPARGGTGAMRHRRRRPGRVRRDRLRTGGPRRAQLRLAQPRGRASQRHEPAAVLAAAHRSDLRVRPQRPASRSPAATCIAARARRRRARPLLLRRLRREPRLVRRAHRSCPPPARRRRATASSTRRTSAPAAASPSSFGVDAAGELYVVNYTGTVYRLFSDMPAPPGPPTPPEEGPGRRRPPGTPPTGIAVQRGASFARPRT